MRYSQFNNNGGDHYQDEVDIHRDEGTIFMMFSNYDPTISKTQLR